MVPLNAMQEEDGDLARSKCPLSQGGYWMGRPRQSIREKVYVRRKNEDAFKMLAGQEEAKDNLKEIVDFLKKPGKNIKRSAPDAQRGLLVGPPGTGKNLNSKSRRWRSGVSILLESQV